MGRNCPQYVKPQQQAADLGRWSSLGPLLRGDRCCHSGWGRSEEKSARTPNVVWDAHAKKYSPIMGRSSLWRKSYTLFCFMSRRVLQLGLSWRLVPHISRISSFIIIIYTLSSDWEMCVFRTFPWSPLLGKENNLAQIISTAPATKFLANEHQVAPPPPPPPFKTQKMILLKAELCVIAHN